MCNGNQCAQPMSQEHTGANGSIVWCGVGMIDDEGDGCASEEQIGCSVEHLQVRMAVKRVMQCGHEGSTRHDDDADVIELIERSADAIRVRLEGVERGREREAGDSA